MNKKLEQMATNRQKKKRLVTRAFAMALFMALFTQFAQAQQNVYMHTGSRTLVGNETVKFYDSGGESSGPAYYWERWFSRNEDYTFTFKPESGKKIKATFKQFTAYTDNNGASSAHAFTTHENWSLRLNTAELSIYDGLTTDAENLISTYTGSVINEFTVIADGAMTFHFQSYGFREEGWYAEVEQVETYSVQKPSISFEVCSDDVVLNANNKGAALYYYTTDGNEPDPEDPLSTATLYDGPFHVEVDDVVKAIAVVEVNENLVSSAVASLKYTRDDVTPTPGLATVTREGNTITMTPAPLVGDINETYEVWYKIGENGALQQYTEPFEWSTPRTKFYVYTRAQSCSDKISPAVTLDFEKVQVPDPTITFTVTDENTGKGTVQINCPAGYVLSYTTDGSDPVPSTSANTNSVTLNNVAPGTTIKAIAFKITNGALDPDYQESDIVTLLCLPGGDGQSGAYGDVVILDDREEHTWSYYSDKDQPIHCLKPADVKITYYGNSPAGRTTMTNANENGENPSSFSATASGVAVGIDAPANQFIYFKTLENANPEGSSGDNQTYPYTTIPNPFSVRPTGASGTGTTTVTTYDKVTSSQNWTESNYLLVYESGNLAFDGNVNYNGEGQSTSVTISNSVINDSGSAALLTFVQAATSGGTTYYYFKNGNTFYGANSSGELITTASTPTNNTSYQWSVSISNGTLNMINRGQSPRHMVYSSSWGFYPGQSSVSNNLSLYKATEHTTQTTVPGWRGFYAWRVKSLSSGLTIQRANGTSVSVNDTIHADSEIKFITANAKGNEVEFEALWAQAYVGNNTYSGLNENLSYERNFLVLTGDDGSVYSGVAYTIPTTISALYPNGTTDGTTVATSVPDVGLSGDFSAQSDTKFENILLYNYYQNNNNNWVQNVTYTANNHNMIFGRGISEGVNRVCGNTDSGTVSGAVAYTIRMESGTYNEFDLLNNTGGTYGSTVSAKAVIGCDYDRAKGDNDKLHLAPSGPVYGKSGLSGATLVFNSSSNRNNVTFDWYVKSGQVQENLLGSAEGGDQSIYLGSTASGNELRYSGKRHITVEGGELASIAGGVNNSATGYGDYAVNDGDPTVLVRMKGGTVRGAVYGAGEYGASSGDVRFVFTGGTVNGWIAGGCNGTHDDGGELYGITYIYMGGKAKLEPSSDDPYIGTTTSYGKNGAYGGYIFGAGCGLAPTDFDEANTNPQWSLLESNTVGKVFGSRIVIADECEVGRDVYGGGNFGFVADASLTNNTDMKSEIYMLGGTLYGDIQGGSNNSNGQTVNIYIKGGELVGRDSENPTFPDDPLEGSVYGGSDAWGTINGPATITMTGGHLHGSVFGGGYGSHTDMKAGTFINISGGTIDQNVYGGGEEGTVSNGETHIEVSGGTMKDVFGAGKGATSEPAKVTGQTFVTVSGGTVVNVYGGGEAGDIEYAESGSSAISIEPGTLTFNLSDSYGDGWNGASITVSFSDGTASQSMTISNGSSATNTVTVGSDVDVTLTWTSGNYDYECSFTVVQNGETVLNASTPASQLPVVMTTKVSNATAVASTVTVKGGNISGDVFGGGKLGKTTGNTQVNVESGNVRGSVFGGAYGAPNKVYVAGQHSVNIMGGRIFSNVYGGSRNANDALTFEDYSTTEKETSSVVNISAGQIDQQVYAAGYYGKTFGSVYVFVGTEAILKAPHKNPSFGDDNENKYKAGNLRIAANIWAGGDWGTFSGGSFGAPTVSGYSDIYVNGDGYNTETSSESAPTYMNIGGSILGSGTSCDAGKQGRTIMVSNYGAAISSGSKNDDFPEPYTEATRTLYSIQRADRLILDNAHINFTGLAKVNSIDATEKYAIYSFDETVRIVGGSSLFMNAVTSQIVDFWSASCDDIYAANATYTPVAYNAVAQTPNKIRVNGGNYIEIYHDKMPMTVNGSTVYQAGYGMLNGFAYMMVSEKTSENTCAYARPKWCQDTPIESELNNATDGGWVSYDSEKNTYDIDGYSHTEGSHTLGTLVQMPYENHKNVSSKNGELYFRIWRAGGKYSEREAVINLTADGSNTYGVVAVSVKLPAWKTANSYYMFQSTSADGVNYNTTIDYGADLKTYNSAMTDTIPANMDDSWIHYENNAMASGSVSTALQEIDNMPNVNYGLVTAPGTAMSGNPLIVCGESDAFLAQVTNGQVVNKFPCGDFEHNPEVTFLLTYSNQISTNMSWDPMYITLVQKDENGNEIDIVKIAIIVNTATTIDREFTTQVYAVMNGTGSPHDEYVAKVTLPTFELFDPTAAHASMFNVTNVVFEPVQDVTTQDCWMDKGSTFSADNKFAMEIGGSTNEDNSDGWNGTSTGMKDSKTVTQPANKLLGESSGRMPFAIDFRLTYDGQQTYTGDKPFLGTLTFTITYDNVKVPTLVNGQPTYDSETGEQIFHSETKTLTIHVQVYRRGTGNAFYLDGQNGSNGYDGRNPDRAALSLSTILNRLGFMAGDIIYVVNTVDVASDLDWIGTRYDHVQIYRYPGNHQLATEDGIIDNDENEAFVGPLVNVKEKGKMTLRDIVLDGHDEEHPCPNPINTSKEDAPVDASVTAESPLATIASGGTLTLTSGAKLQHNTSTSNGGAVVVNDGGTLMMNENATIRHNTILGETSYGGGVYMDGTIIASDSIKIDTNYKASAFNNLYLTTADKVLTIGTSVSTDDFDGLTEDAHIGVTKTAADDDGWYRVVNVESDSDIEWLAVPYGMRPNDIVYHDGQKFQLEKHTNPLYLYWVGTWVTMQDWNPKYASATAEGYNANDMDVTNITTREQLAWLISMVNGSNGATANDFSGKTININADLNMEEYIWVPIGTDQTPFKGTFEGNGHVITGIRTPLVNNDAGLMGYTQGATVQDVIVNVNFTGNSINQGAIIGEMNGGTLCNAEAAGTMNGSENTVNMGGLVGLVSNNGKVHSSFAVNDMTATEATTVVGGLVGTNGGNLYNSYANTTMTGVEGTHIGGLVGVNNTGCTVENCYVILGENTFPAFAHTNNGTITICYADKGDNYVSADVTGNVAPTSSGTYGEVLGRNAFGYMYGDNLIAKNTNTYVGNNSVTDEGGLTTYINKHIPVWNGLLSALNQWVRGHQNQGYASWNRATSPDINGDLPILAFPKDNSLGTSNGKFLVYSAFDRNDLANHNGLDNLLGTIYNGQAANIFLYDSTRNVVSGTGNNKLFIHEDAALLQAASSKAEIKAVVGVTFDNSCKTATDYDGKTLEYDWHLMSTPLSNALMGISYNTAENNWWENEDTGQITGVENSYLPDGSAKEDFDHWDFYCYYEPQYHWINFKRSSKNHYHWDEPHDPISYTNESQLTPSKGYMVAIDQDSYLSNVGTLNGPQSNVTIGLTCSGTLPEEDEPTKDWGSNLVGNPYQAYLDLDKVGASTRNGGTGFTKFYVYDADEKTYVPFTLSQSENPVTPSQYIHPHQAFFVLTDANGDFKLTYDMATTKKENGSYFRGKDRVNYPLVNLFVDNEAGNRDLAIIELGRPELGGAEKINALRNANFKVYAHFDGNNYGLLFTPKDAERVPVHFKTREDGTFTMTWSTYNGTFTSLFLVDNMTGTRVNMLQEDHYTFVGNTDDYAARFYLTFAFTDVEEYNYNDGGDFAWFDGSEWIINGEGQLRVVDMTGRVLQSQTLKGDQNRIHLEGYAAGVYVMNLINGNTTKSQKIVIR